MKTKAVFFIFFIFFIYLFLVFSSKFKGPDEPIYYAYTASVVEDGDLNAVNHLDSNYPYYLPDGKIGISSTYNLPDFHNHGGVVLWAPFYLYGKLVYFIDRKIDLMKLNNYGPEDITKCAMSFSTMIFGFVTLLLTFLFCRFFFSDTISAFSTFVMFIATPYFYFTMQDVGNANIIASLFSVLSIWFLGYAIRMKKTHWFLCGLFFSICFIVKVDLWFQIFSIALVIFILILLKKAHWSCGVYFLFGFTPGFILKTINDYIKYGTLHMGEFGLLNFKDCYFWEQLFSPYHGFFYTSPVFFICMIGFILTIIYFFRLIL